MVAGAGWANRDRGPSSSLRRRLGRRVAVVLAAVALVVSGVDQSAWASASAQPVPPTPQQRSGSAAGAPHSAPPATATTKGGAAPVTPTGAAPDAGTQSAPLDPHVSGGGQTAMAKPAPPRTRTAPPVSTGQEITAKRTATMSVFANPDGTDTAKVYPRPVHYRASDGSWADIDTTLGQGGNGRWAEKADSASTSFAATAADSALASVPAGPGQSIAFGLQGAANVPGTATGSTITYPGIANHTDASYLATVNGGVKETLTLSSADAPTTFVFPLTLTGLSPSVTSEGSVVFTNAAGQVVDTISHGFMRDSNIDPRSDEGVFSNGVTYTLTTVDGKPALQVSVDAAWLHDPARVFPVQVDPSIANLNTSGSTYVMSPFNNDYSGDPVLDVGTYDGGGNVANAYLKFDVGSLTNDYIEAATLDLDDAYSYSCQARPVWVSPITSGWGVGGLKTYPWVSIGGAIGSSSFAAGYSSGCPAQWESIDLGDNPSAAGTQLIESWTHGGVNNGLAVTADPHDSFGWKKFDSLNSPYPPYLSITYSAFGAAYSFPNTYVQPTGTTSGSQQVTLTNLGNNTWQPGSQHLWYQLYDTNWNNLHINGSVDPWTELPTSVAPNQTITMTGNIGKVTPGQYYLCWDMFDGNTSSNLSYGVDSPCELINSANTPPQIDTSSPPSNAVLSSLQPQLFATGHDPDNYPGSGITYDFRVYSVPAGGGTPSLVVDSGAQSSGDYRVQAGKLGWNQSYYWTVSDSDTLGSSNWSTPAYFSTAVPQPLVTAHLGVNTSKQNFDPGVGDYTSSATDATDATVAAAGPALAVTRSYNSQDPRTAGLFGSGWSTVYDMAATPDADGSGNVVVAYPDGHTVRFGLNSDGATYTPPQGTYAIFKPVTGGGYSLTARGGSTYTFGQQVGGTWKLTSIADSSGRAQTLAYDGSGNLATVTNTGGNRALHFTWSGGHVATVATDPATVGGQALTWSYTYSGNTLTKVCPPTSSTACTTYSYTSGTTPGSHYRSTVLDAQPSAYWRLNNTDQGTTASDEVAANLGTKNGTFCVSTQYIGKYTGPLAGSPTTGDFFGGNCNVTLPNNLVSSATYLTVQLWFKSASTDPGGVLFSTGHSAIGSSNPSTGAMPVLYIGSDHKLYGQFWTGIVAPIVSTGSVQDGLWHQVNLVGQGSSQSLYLDGQLVGTRAGTLANLDPMNFIGAGYVNGNPWVNAPTTNGWSYFTGKVAEAAFYTKSLGAPAIAQQYAAATQPAAELTSITTPAGKTNAQVTYNNVLDRATQVTDQYGGAWALAPPAAAGSSAQYRGAVFASNPTDYWPLTDTTGSQAVDLVPTSAISASSDGYGTYNNVTLGQAGPFTGTGDTAASFNGTTSSLTVPVQSSSWSGTGKTLSAWFKTTTPGSVLIGWGDSALVYIGSDGKLYSWYGSGYLASPGTVTDGKWHYAVVAQSVNVANYTIVQTEYLDGNAVATATAPTNNSAARPTTTIGSGAFGTGAPASAAGTNPGGFFTGSLADVAFYNTPLTATTVTGLYTAAQTSSSSATPITTATVTDPGSHSLAYRYDPANGGRLISSTDGLGNTTRYTFDTNGFGYTTIHPDGNYVTATHDPRGNVLSRTTGDSSGATATSYATYPAAGTYAVTDPRNDEPLTTLTADSAGPSDTTYRTSYTYNTAGELLTLTNPVGAVTTNTYTAGTEAAVGGGTEPAGLLATQQDPNTHTTTYSYTAAGDAATTVAPSGLSTSATFDQLGRKLSTTQTSDTYPAGISASYAWDGQNRLTTQTGPATTDAVTGTTHTPQTSYTYDADSNVLTRSSADTTGGDTTRTATNTYNSHDELATSTDPANRQSSYGYDSYGNRTSTTDPVGNAYTDSFDADGHHTATTLTNWTGDPNNPISPTSLVLDSRAYDPDGYLASDTDAMGRTTTYTYDNTGRPLSSTLANYHNGQGVQTPVTLTRTGYDAAGNPTSQFDLATAPGTTSFVVDPAGRVTTSTDPTGHATTFTYDNNDQVLTKSVSNGSVTEETDYGYDTLGDQTSQSVHNGSVSLITTATYDQRGALTSTVDPRGNVTGGTPANYTTTYTTDPAGQLTMVTGALVNAETGGGTPAAVHPISQYGYNTFGDKTSASNPDGNITSYTYDPDSEVLGISQNVYTPPGGSPLTPLTTFTYTPLGYLASTTDPLNHTTSYTNDQLGHRVTTTQPAVGGTSPVWHYTYDTDGEQLSATDPTGAQTQATYDELGQPFTSTQVVRQPTSSANTTTYAYDPTQASGNDPAGQPLSITLPGAQQTRFGYDALGQNTSQTDPGNHTTSFAFDADGHLTKTTLPDGTATTASYDPAGRQTGAAQLDATGATLRSISAAYDAAGNTISSTDANGVTITHSIDAANRQTQQVQPVSSTHSVTTGYGYDAAGHLSRYTDGNGDRTLFTYNTLALPESVIEPTVPGFTTPADTTTTIAYNADSRPTQRTRPGGVTQTTTYDELSRITAQSGTGAETTTATRSVGYDPAGRLTSTSTPTGTNTYTYDDAGHILSATGPSGAASYAYNSNGQLASRTDTTGTATFTYTPDGQLATAADPLTGATATYTYNTLDQPTGVSYGTGTAAQSNSYNSAHQLTAQTLTAPGGGTEASISYGYDNTGNITSKTTAGTAGAGANTYTYDQAGRLATSTLGGSTTNYGYDDSGNRTQAGTSSYTYNARNELITATTPAGSTSATYDARGALTATTGANAASYGRDAFDQITSAGTTSYTYDALGRASTAGSHIFAYDGTDTVPTGDGTQTFSRGPDGQLLSVNTGSGAAAAFTDQHGDLTALYTPTGTSPTGSTAFDPWGAPTAISGTQPDLGYQGGWTDNTGTGFVATASRWYDPTLGAFTSHDTLTNLTGTAAAANPYTYGNDNPLTNTDPTGQSSCGTNPRGGGSRATPARNPRTRTAPPSAPSWTQTSWGAALYGAGLGLAYGSASLGYTGSLYARSPGSGYAQSWGNGSAQGALQAQEEAELLQLEVQEEEQLIIEESMLEAASSSTECVIGEPAKPPKPTDEELANRAPINARPSGQSDPAGDVETPEPGTKTPATGPSDEPVNTNTVAQPNPAEAATPFTPTTQAKEFSPLASNTDAGSAADDGSASLSDLPRGSINGENLDGAGRPVSRLALQEAMREPPNAEGSTITSRVARPGEEFNMVISRGQPPSRPGGFGTFEDVPNQDFVRYRLAIRTDWKPDVSLVQRYAIPSGDPIRIQESVIGPQEDPLLGHLPGGATQLEILNFEDRARLIPMGDPWEIP